MASSLTHSIAFTRLTEIAADEIVAHMSDPRIAQHLPLLNGPWDESTVADFIKTKEEYWHRDGLGHWAILDTETYIGWGGFQKEEEEWDFGLVLKPCAFGLGPRIFKKALQFAFSEARIPFVTCLVPPSRQNLRALRRFGAKFIQEVDYRGVKFLKYRLETESPLKKSLG